MNSLITDSKCVVTTTNSTISLLLILLLTATLAACGESSTGPETNGENGIGNGNGNGNGEEEVRGPNEVWMEGMSFLPGNLEVEVGTTVTWTNKGADVHTVTSGEAGDHDNLFDSGNLSSNATFEYTFDETGTYDYFCRPHVDMGMTGRITVVENGDGGNSGSGGTNNPGGNGQGDDDDNDDDYEY